MRWVTTQHSMLGEGLYSGLEEGSKPLLNLMKTKSFSCQPILKARHRVLSLTQSSLLLWQLGGHGRMIKSILSQEFMLRSLWWAVVAWSRVWSWAWWCTPAVPVLLGWGRIAAYARAGPVVCAWGNRLPGAGETQNKIVFYLAYWVNGLNEYQNGNSKLVPNRTRGGGPEL